MPLSARHVRSIRARAALARLLFISSGLSPLLACGPWFPETLLDKPKSALEPPIVNFELEVRAIPPPSAPPAVARNIVPPSDDEIYFRHYRQGERIAEAESAELDALLLDQPEARRKELVTKYRAFREAILSAFGTKEDFANHFKVSEQGSALLDEAMKGNWPLPGLPEDIQLYLEGALQYHQGKAPEALAIWKRLLALPDTERRNRSVAATWMIARVVRDTQGLLDSRPWFEQCAQLSGEGYADPLGLGLSALGWIAKTYLQSGDPADYRRAMELYYHQLRAGEHTAWASLWHTVKTADNLSDSQLRDWAADPFLRGLQTAALLARSAPVYGYADTPRNPGRSTSVRWLDALENAGLTNLPAAAQFAELAYRSGEFEVARRWLERAPDANRRALWIRGKLNLMEGRVADAERDLRAARPPTASPGAPVGSDPSASVRAFRNPSEAMRMRTNQVHGDLGTIALARDHYLEALDALLQGGFWDDAAYISERVLSREELLTYVRNRYPEAPERAVDGPPAEASLNAKKLRYLLARRLARELYFKDARPFFPTALLPVFDRYVTLFRQGRDSALPQETRAQALWEAAQIHRTLGLALFGTEEGPDSATYAGDFEASWFTESRLGLSFEHNEKRDHWRWDYIAKPTEFIPQPSASERYRVKRSRMPFEQRFHYRYVAAEMAWKAADLMPRNSEETARVLAIAGLWLAHRDPQAADRFYKAMIWRNWSTPLARAADERRWFPPLDWKYDPWAAAGVKRERLGLNHLE